MRTSIVAITIALAGSPLQAQERERVVGVYPSDLTPVSPSDAASEPSELSDLREKLKQTGERGGVQAFALRRGDFLLAVVEGVPIELRDIEVRGEDDLLPLIDLLYPYYGFTGSETLQFESHAALGGSRFYDFRQYIRGIATDRTLQIVVRPNLHIASIEGALVLDVGLNHEHPLSQSEALRAVRSYRDADKGTRVESAAAPGEASLIYRTIADPSPWWHIEVAGRTYFVESSGAVQPAEVVIP